MNKGYEKVTMSLPKDIILEVKKEAYEIGGTFSGYVRISLHGYVRISLQEKLNNRRGEKNEWKSKIF
jgi:hypothetical protein|tara:strand:+ start:33756 stop:33956 length:201 start_codon:yes stop_codon:yes gene_type:complete